MDETFNIRTELLILRAQGGSADALDALIRHWTPALERIVAQWIAGDEPRREIIQRTWIEVSHSLLSLNEPAHFPGWIRRIALRRAAAVWKEQPSTEPLDHDLAAIAQTPSWVPILLGLLSPSNRRLLAMHYIEGYSIEEIAEGLRIPSGTVKSRLHASRRYLRRRLSW